MDTEGLLMFGLMLLGFALAIGFVITVTAGAISRLRASQRPADALGSEARLARIEATMEEIARELSHLRASRQAGLLLEGDGRKDRRELQRPVTPH